MPEITPIDVWGGTPNGWSGMRLPAQALWVHHSVTNASDDAFADFRTLNRIGLSNGHGGISYSFVIHPNGTIGEGQGTRRGAHTAGNGCGGSPWGWNICSFGVCFVGNYMQDELTPTAIDAFRWLRDHLIGQELLQPGDYPTGGHRDAPGNSTACPGNNIEGALDVLRAPYSGTSTPTTVQEHDMYLAWGTGPFGNATAVLAAGSKAIKTFTGPPGAYGIPQDALDWKATGGKDAVPWICVEPDVIGALTKEPSGAMAIAWGKNGAGVAVGFLVSGGRVLKTFTGTPGFLGIPQDALDWKAQPGHDAVDWIVCDPSILDQLAAAWPTGGGGSTPANVATKADVTASRDAVIAEVRKPRTLT